LVDCCVRTEITQTPAPAAAAAAGVVNSTEPVTAAPAPAKTVKDTAAVRDAEDTDDTMRNLRKTFAGIFGDM